MHVLVINSGSSSVKFSIFACEGGETRSVAAGEASGLGTGKPEFRFADAAGVYCAGQRVLKPEDGVAEVGHVIAEAVSDARMPRVEAVGHRVVHPGATLTGHCRITPEVMTELRGAIGFAPLHEPAAIDMIEEMHQHFQDAPQFACFDTVFHETMPEAAKTYALPKEVRARGVRRYGFHGLSCESIVGQMREAAERGEIAFPKRLVIAHLGSGCSVTAVVDGKSVDTTMGLTPDGGVVMGTRPGDLDPGVVLYLLRQQGGDREQTVAAVEGMLNREAGVHALSGIANDMKQVRQAAADGDANAVLALEVFTRSVTKAVGGFVALMGGVDAVVFTAGIGEHDAASRREIVASMAAFGIALDERRNSATGDGLRDVSADGAAAKVYVAPAEEDRMIARHVAAMY